MTKVTLDTNVLPADDLIHAAQPFDCEFAVVTVTAREVEGTRYEIHLTLCTTINETAVWGQSSWGKAMWGSDMSQDALDEILGIVSNGGFPRSRANLSDGQLRQLRDAMILEAHLRERRHIFVTRDRKAFVEGGSRETLAARFGVRIMLAQEFLTECSRAQGMEPAA
jgi:hypothetical protein